MFKVDGQSHTMNVVRRFCDMVSHVCDTNAKRYRGRGCGGPNPFAQAADFLGHTRFGPLTHSQQSFRKDVMIWVEASSSASAHITDDRRFFQTFTNEWVLALFEICLLRTFQMKPVKLVSAESCLFEHRN